jgi:uncharacterized protein (DUF885 family)
MGAGETVRELTDHAWDRVLDRDPVAALRCGRKVDTLPQGGSASMEHDVALAVGALDRLAAIDGLSGDDRLAAEYLRDHLVQEVAEAERYWYRFPVTPYNAYLLSSYRSDVFAVAELTTAADVDRYLRLLDDYAALVEQIGDTLGEQRRRGIRLPAWAVPEAAHTVRGHADASPDLVVAPDRLAALPAGPAGRLADGVAHMVEGRLAAAYGRLLDDLANEAAEGGDGVGIGQYRGGAECYGGLIRLHTGLDLSAERVHAIGLAEVDRITARIRDELGVHDEPAYRRALGADPRVYAASPAEAERLFQGHIDRLRPHLSRYFARVPDAPFRLRRLDASLGGLTYGFYEPPGLDGCGYYHYNAADLPDRPLLQAASVIYHEGLPGHHMQFGRQLENAALHPIRREATELRTFALNGYVEGWAEYAAGLCDEIGLYDDPLDRYGRLSAERFHAARLVLDTGLNVLGWSRDRAAQYLRVNGFLSEVEIGTELLRYAVDDPGQALAYHLGHWYLRELRGDRDPLEFHEAVLADGPLPLELLGRHLRGELATSS